VTALHEDAMREAIAADGEAHRALLAGEDAREPLRRAANAYRASWEAAPPRSFGRLVGYAKASILAGENPAPYVREHLRHEADSPPAYWALALAALADGDDEAARGASDGMLAGSEAFGRAAGVVADFEARGEHLTGVPIADTALVLDRLAERRGLAVHPRSPLLPEVDDVRAILTGTHVWAVVGCSPDPNRDSHRIASMLKRRGYQMIPVNPLVTEVLGERSFPTLSAIPADAGVEVVDIFRRADVAGAHVDEAVEIGARAVWMQLGVVDEAAAERGRAAGLRVVMDRCPAIELPRLGL
jgi:predicted CoA-binding protein